MQGRVGVVRIGQLCGDKENGVWNSTEAWPLMLGASEGAVGGVPRLKGEELGWLAVDEAAGAVLEVGDALEKTCGDRDEGGEGEVPVYHILNPDRTRTWDDLLRWIKNLRPELEILSPQEWLNRLENLDGAQANHPAKKLIGLWRSAYDGEGKDEKEEDVVDGGKEEVVIKTENAKRVSKMMREVKPVSEEAFGKMWRWIEENVGVVEGGGEGKE